MIIKIVKCLEDNFSYLLIDELTKSTIVIDPSEAEPIINKIESLNLKLKFIMNTHHHYDHVGGNKELKKLYNAKVIGFHEDKHRIPEIDISLKKPTFLYENFNTRYTNIILTIIAKIILILSYSLLIDISVVSVPGPAINGNAIGIIEAVLGF